MIYIAHSREFDFENQLYAPVRASKNLPQSSIVLPHEPGHDPNHGRQFYANLDLLIAEVSYPATGLGIELGWASDDNVPIVCLCQSGKKYSGSLRAVTDRFYEYHDLDEIVSIIDKLCREVTTGS